MLSFTNAFACTSQQFSEETLRNQWRWGSYERSLWVLCRECIWPMALVPTTVRVWSPWAAPSQWWLRMSRTKTGSSWETQDSSRVTDLKTPHQLHWKFLSTAPPLDTTYPAFLPALAQRGSDLSQRLKPLPAFLGSRPIFSCIFNLILDSASRGPELLA